jgi:carbon-monoxide dehydrogenase small subunit
MAQYRLRVNGREHDIVDASACESLLFVLRERLGFPAAKEACGQGQCGSCTVLIDGAVQCSCLVLAAAAIRREITTVEGLAPSGQLTDVQRAFVDAGAVQCGFCTPGLVVAVHDFLDRCPDPSDIEIRMALAGNLCRCTGYGRVIAAVRTAATRRQRDQA